ncbi:hypothetical protein VE03_06193 [Pseudogymnoascus sp. 23342-1-I1]|nr:hypothetical protein VE03_06193 [Pseudogymnoascus sp. 23342-1-I1]
MSHWDGSAVKIQKSLDVALKTPVELFIGTEFTVKLDPWAEFVATGTNTQIDPSTVAVVAKLSTPEAYTINDEFVVNISVNGDLTKDAKIYTDSIVITQDSQ